MMTDSTNTGERTLLYFDDLHVGQRFASRTYPLDEKQIVSFASQFDPQPFHTDPEAAKQTFFKGLAASGWQTAAITMRLLVESAPIAGGVIGAGAEINWPLPTRPGAVLHVESEVQEVRPLKSRPDRGMVTIRTETKNEAGEIVQVLISKLVVPRKCAPE